MSNLQDSARQIFLSGLQAVDARAATQRAVSINHSLLQVCETEIDIAGRSVYLVAIGKAAWAMAAGLIDVLGERIRRGIVCGPAHDGIQLPDWPTFNGGHPLPTEESVAAARAALRLLEDSEENSVVIFLISGGGSAMFELPVSDEISLADLREANRQLIACGASISEINAVRRAFSAVKGGKLALAAPNSDQITLIVSDTNPDDMASVASGPTITPDTPALNAADMFSRYGLKDSLPKSIMAAVADEVTESRRLTKRLRKHYVLLDNRTALEAAALRATGRGFVVEIATDINEQEIETGCDLLLTRANQLWNQSGGKPICLLSGGEFSCPVRGDGVGGRNLETVLRCALKLGDLSREKIPDWVVLSAGTDGIDGNSPAAGAVADEVMMRRAIAEGVSGALFLSHSDSFNFFDPQDLLVSGPTGTNVRDVRVVLMEGARNPE
ncbi:MAG TPA: DUF4147 domain-containing protein [Pyrinomonadaceae bacterium]|nr:DUF4147 domain-containing protein [Pyrinomonadaceae bacterium]